MTGDGRVTFRRDGPVGHVTFDRPAARNAMTWAMYRDLRSVCERVPDEPGLRVLVLRGAGGRAFVAGTDIAQFRAFATAEDGIAYEREMEGHIAALERLPMPTVAVIEGWATGGGLTLAAACDLRIAASGARVGVPVARTVGNTISLANHARLMAGFGAGRAKRMLMLGEMLDAAEALACGFLAAVVPPADLDATVSATVARLLGNAPLTMGASKEAIRRVLAGDTAEAEDLIGRCYASADFREGVDAFLAKRPPGWRGA